MLESHRNSAHLLHHKHEVHKERYLTWKENSQMFTFHMKYTQLVCITKWHVVANVLLTVEFEAAGIDTVGDVRVPAACCGVFGFRSSHGAVSLEGTIPVASSCDALGELLMSSFQPITSSFKEHPLHNQAVINVNSFRPTLNFIALEVQNSSSQFCNHIREVRIQVIFY